MRYKVIACSVFSRELSLLVAHSDAVLDVTWIRQGLHSYPSLLRDAIQREIDAAEQAPPGPDHPMRPPEEYAAIILGFGLCSRAVSGLRSDRLPLVIPRSHDCIGILLGSHQRYLAEFAAVPGTYWFSPGWIEQSAFPSGDQCRLLADRFGELYGEENGTYLVQHERDSLAAYTRAALIRRPELDREEYYRRVAEISADFGWDVVVIDGDNRLLDNLVNGRWNDDEVVVCPPGSSIEIGSEEDVIVARVPGA